MKIHEYQGKQLLSAANVPVPRGIVARTPEEAAAAFEELGGPLAVVKAQIHAGGRGKGTIKDNPKQHGVQLVRSAKEAADVAKNLLGHELVTTPLFGWGTKIRMGLEYFRQPQGPREERSVSQFIEEHYGVEPKK